MIYPRIVGGPIAAGEAAAAPKAKAPPVLSQRTF